MTKVVFSATGQAIAEPIATTDLASRLLIGRGAPRDPERGVALLMAGAAQGDGEAAALLATLSGSGAWMPQNWDVAFSYLEQAAAQGSRSARGQLVHLAGGATGDASRAMRGEDAADWSVLRRDVDITSWLKAPERQILCEAPRVRFANCFVSRGICDWLIQKVRGKMRQALMYHGSTRTEVLDPHRSCSDYEFDIVSSDLIGVLVRARISALTLLPTVTMEPPRIFHYALGQDIKPHYDRLNDGIGGYGVDGSYAGDRLVTFLLYLNDDFDGGELEFPKVGKRFKGRTGDAVYFAHVDPKGVPDPLSLHAGLPITRGEKWVMSQWIHDRPLAT